MSNQNSTIIEIGARSYTSFSLSQGQLIRFTDLEGSQPIDFWAFNHADIYEHLSCEHTKPSIEKVYPQIGDSAYTNHRRPNGPVARRWLRRSSL